MTKLEAKLVKAALIWHVCNAFKGRPLRDKQDRQLRIAAVNLLKKQDDKLTEKHLAIAGPARNRRKS